MFERQLQTNYLGNVCTVKLALPAMLERRQGHVVLIASSLAVLGALDGRGRALLLGAGFVVVVGLGSPGVSWIEYICVTPRVTDCWVAS